MRLYRLEAHRVDLQPVRWYIFAALGEAQAALTLLQQRSEILHLRLHELELDTALTPQDWANLVQTGPGMRTDAILRDRLTVGRLLAEWRREDERTVLIDYGDEKGDFTATV